LMTQVLFVFFFKIYKNVSGYEKISEKLKNPESSMIIDLNEMIFTMSFSTKLV